MNADDIRLLYRYNSWANRRVLDACAALDDEQFTRDLRSSHPSVRDTLVHMLAAEEIWLRRWHGESPKTLLDPSTFTTLEHVRAHWTGLETELHNFTARLTDDALARTITYTNTRGEVLSYTLGRLMLHVVNHATYHRGQVATMLRQLGARPAPTDFFLYSDED